LKQHKCDPSLNVCGRGMISRLLALQFYIILEIRSVERGICLIGTFTINELFL